MTPPPEPSPPSGSALDPTPSPAERPGAVLVVDDSRFVRASLVRGLSSRFDVRQADSGEQAWQVLQQDPTIGVVLSDLSMPGIDGFELLRRVRGSADARLRALPFAVLSGADDAAHRELADTLGADRFELKGRGLDALCGWIDACRAVATAAAGPAHGTPRSPVAPSAAEAAPAETTASELSASGLSASRTSASETSASETSRAELSAGELSAAELSAADGYSAEPSPAQASASGASPLQPSPVVAVPPPTGRASPPTVPLRVEVDGAPGWADRLRRGVRAADGFLVDPLAGALLRVAASDALALRLALRLGLLAAGPAAVDGGAGARVTLRIGEPPRGPAARSADGVAMAAGPPDAVGDGPGPAGAPPGLRLVVHTAGTMTTRLLRWPVVRLLLRPGVPGAPRVRTS